MRSPLVRWVVSCALARLPGDSVVVLALDYVVAAGHPGVGGEGASVGEPDVVLERPEKGQAARHSVYENRAVKDFGVCRFQSHSGESEREPGIGCGHPVVGRRG